MPRSKSRYEYDARHQSPYINEKKNKEPSFLDQLFCFGDDLIDMIDDSLGLSNEETATSSLREEDSTVLSTLEQSIKSYENEHETELSAATSLGEEEDSRNDRWAEPEDNYLQRDLRNKYKKQQKKNKKKGISINNVENDSHVRFALDEHDVVMEMMMKESVIALA